MGSDAHVDELFMITGYCVLCVSPHTKAIAGTRTTEGIENGTCARQTGRDIQL